MKTLHQYLIRQVLGTLLMTVAVFTFVLLLGNGLKEILPLLISGQVKVGLVAEAFGLLIPWVLVFALPMGMLTAALLVFGRFSADQELTAVKSSGISLISLITPILLLSVLLCGGSAWINLEIAPQCRVAYKRLLDSMKTQMGESFLPEGRVLRIGDSIFFARSRREREYHDVYLYELEKDGQVKSEIRADRATLETTGTNHILTFYDPFQMDATGGGTGNSSTAERELDFSRRSGSGAPGLSDMTFFQLQAELKKLEVEFSAPAPKGLDPEAARKQMAMFDRFRRDVTLPVRVQMHRQVAFSFACLGFTLVGIPLGIKAHRRETNIGFAMALLLVLVYYSFIIVGQSLQTRPEWMPCVILWLPNFIFQAAGAVMLRRANRGI